MFRKWMVGLRIIITWRITKTPEIVSTCAAAANPLRAAIAKPDPGGGLANRIGGHM
jgi:adenosine/AMP kinase